MSVCQMDTACSKVLASPTVPSEAVVRITCSPVQRVRIDAPIGLPVTVYLARDSRPNGDFCCVSNLDVTSGNCMVPSGGSWRPFQLSPGTVTYDRNTGSLLPQNWTGAAEESEVTVASDSGKHKRT
ncbi:hypothetical protein CERZMDRAFT_94483 [Cercospora zeae-maydis SCOH1-5]|uniref:Uncharacterized protein n=1 Tax=Cercospora zeae-maydis SCOH1-5 TaxID=717836 RepID=A0A6A6FS49_9PEZI|nr:hypothetical protein CERZMDRAFT_94483 [Cercospora zeae-maydis SCOH1-5]